MGQFAPTHPIYTNPIKNFTLGTRNPQKPHNSLLAPSRPSNSKCPQESSKRQISVKVGPFFSCPFSDIWDFLSLPAPESLRDSFETFLACQARRVLWLAVAFSLVRKVRAARLQKEPGPETLDLAINNLECRKWGFKRWGFQQIRGYPRKKAFFLRFLDFPGVVRALRKRAGKAENGRKRPILADFQERRADAP